MVFCSELEKLQKKTLHLAAMCSSMASLIETNEANNWKCGQFTGVRLYLEAFHIPKQTTIFIQFDFNRCNQCNRQEATTLPLMINTNGI